MSDMPMEGPRLSDRDFFTQCVDTTRPGLEEIPAAVAEGDYAAARGLFADAARRSLQPQRFLQIDRQFRGANFMRPGESVAEAAERILNLELISTSTPHQFEDDVDWFANPTYNQYKEWTWQLSRHPEWGILAERYRQTGDERYAAAFVRFFCSWVRQAVVPEDAPGNATRCWRTIEAGIRMGGVWQWALHSFYRSPHFTDDVLVDWYKSVWEHGWRLRNFHRTHNWLIMEMNGLAQIGILYPQFRQAEAWKQYAFDVLVRELETQVHPDGMQYELSTGYHQVNIRNYQWLWDVAAAYDEPIPDAFRAGLEKMHAANVKLMMPDGRLPDLNDGGWHQVAPLLERAVQFYPERDDFRWAYTRGKEGHPPAETSLAFEYAGFYVMRSSWASDAIWAFLDGGPFGYAHQHEDKLNLLLHAYGRLLLTEAGNYAYDDSEMRRYVLSTRGHNTIRVDGLDQNRRLHFDRENPDVTIPAGARWYTGDRYDGVVADYDEGYGPQAERLVTHQRKLLFLKQGVDDALGPCFLVVDRLLSRDQAAHEYEVLWHFNTDSATVAGSGVASHDADQPNLAIVATDRPGLALEVVSGQEEPEWQGWKAIKNHQQGEYQAIPTAVYRWRVAGPARLVTLLHPLPAGQEGVVEQVKASADPAETTLRILLENGHSLKLDEADFPIG